MHPTIKPRWKLCSMDTPHNLNFKFYVQNLKNGHTPHIYKSLQTVGRMWTFVNENMMRSGSTRRRYASCVDTSQNKFWLTGLVGSAWVVCFGYIAVFGCVVLSRLLFSVVQCCSVLCCPVLFSVVQCCSVLCWPVLSSVHELWAVFQKQPQTPQSPGTEPADCLNYFFPKLEI